MVHESKVRQTWSMKTEQMRWPWTTPQSIQLPAVCYRDDTRVSVSTSVRKPTGSSVPLPSPMLFYLFILFLFCLLTCAHVSFSRRSGRRSQGFRDERCKPDVNVGGAVRYTEYCIQNRPACCVWFPPRPEGPRQIGTLGNWEEN